MLRWLTIAFMVMAMAFWGNSVLFSDGQWSLERTAVSSIPMNMHGSVVYLTSWQKFLYYDARNYCGWVVALLILAQLAFDALKKRRNRSEGFWTGEKEK